MCEEVMLVYLNKLCEEEKLKPPKIWSTYSMLESTLVAYESLSMKPWDEVNSFMKRLAKRYCLKKSMIFTAKAIANLARKPLMTRIELKR